MAKVWGVKKKRVFCTLQIPGFHHWPDAPDDCAYLKLLHRHMFHFRVEVNVNGLNREVEIIMLQTVVRNLLEDHFRPHADFGGVGRNFGANSCEQLAEFVARNTFAPKASLRGWEIASVEVSEDGENGAVFSLGFVKDE